MTTITVYGQELTSYNYSLEEGLPSSEVYQVYQDKEGFIWFATDNGIVRFDGKEIQTYHTKDGLIDPVVFGFQEDGKGRIWFISYSGKLSYYENGLIKRYKYNDIFPKIVNNGIPTIQYNSASDEVTIFSRKMFGKIDENGNLSSKEVQKEGLFYFGTLKKGVWGLTAYNLDTFTISINEKIFPVELSNAPYKLDNYLSPSRTIFWRDKLYLTIRNNIFSYDGKNLKRVYAGKAPIISFSVDREDNLWIGYISSGTEKHSDGDFNNPIPFPILDNLSVSSVLQDNRMGLWVSTLENGVYYYPNLRIKNYTPQKDLKILTAISDGEFIYKSNQNGDFDLVDAESNKNKLSLEFNSPVIYLFRSKRKNLLLQSGKYTYVYDSQMHLLNKYPINSKSIIEQANGNLWIYGNGAVRELNLEGHITLIDKLAELYRSFILHDSRFYMAGRTGLIVRDKNLKILDEPKDLENHKISAMISLNDSTILMGTLGSGILLLNTKTGKHQKFDKQNKFKADNIYNLQEENDVVWLATDVGLINLSIKSILKGKPKYFRWDKKSGLITNDIKNLALTTNYVWAFSDNGYSIIPRIELNNPEELPQPYLRSILVNERVYMENQTLQLPYDKTNVIIRIGFLSLEKQEIISRYRLLKSDLWTYSEERTFSFNSLAPASYSFDLEYTIDNVNWIPANIPFNFVVNPPWWQLWYFQASALLAVVFLAYLYSRRTIKNYKQKNHFLNVINLQQQKLVKAEIQITERERKRISKELHDGVGTDLAVVKLKVMDLLSKNGNSSSSVKDLNEQFNSAISEIKNISYALTPPDLERFGLIVALSSYLKKLAEAIETKINFNFSGNEIPKGEIEIALFRVIQELINNTLKHAHANSIHIDINSSDVLQLTYTDDGVGFSYENIQSGLGLANIDSRIQSVDGKVFFKSNASGTNYRIEIPLPKNQQNESL